MSFLVQTIKQFTAFINHGISEAELEQHMKHYRSNTAAQLRDFHHTVIDYDPNLVEAVQEVLQAFSIPKYKWDCYIGLNYTFHDVLIEIKKAHPRKTDIEIDLFLELIEKKKRILSRSLLATFGLIIIGAVILLVLYPPAFEILLLLISPTGGLPYLGVSYSGFAAIKDCVLAIYEKKRTSDEKMRDAVFLVASAVLNCCAYVFWILAATSMSPLAAILFVAASAMNVVKELFITLQIYIRYIKRPLIDETSLVEERKFSARMEFGFKRHRNAALINFVGSIILCGLMATWCFAPGGLVMVVGVVAGIIAVNIIKNQLKRYNDKNIRDGLAIELVAIEEEFLDPESEKNSLIEDATIEQQPIHYGHGLKFFARKKELIKPEEEPNPSLLLQQ